MNVRIVDPKWVSRGDVVVVRPGFGTDPPITVTVEGTGKKNGHTLFDYYHGSILSWAYLHQIVHVVSRA